MVFLGFSICSVMSSNNEIFTSFPIWSYFISFSALIAVARTSKCMLKNSGESGHPCLVPDLSENAFSFSPLRITFVLCLSYMAFIVLRHVPSTQFPESFCYKWVLNFVQRFFWIYWDDHMMFFFNLLMWCTTLTDLQILKNPCFPGISLTWSWCMIL